MKIMLWKDRDHAVNPMVSVQLTHPNNLRNVDMSGPLPGAVPRAHGYDKHENGHHHHHQHHHHSQCASIQEISDKEEEDLQNFY